MKKNLLLLLTLCYHLASAQTSKVFTSDIDNFWVAYDSIQTTTDTARQIQFLQTLYFDKATDGFKEFKALSGLTTKKQLNSITKYPKFWASIRSNALKVSNHKSEIEQIMARFKALYPVFKQPDVYFMIGDLNAGGKGIPKKILIGTEIASADSTVDASELGSGLREIFKINKGPMQLIAHETGHTQQKKVDYSKEGNTNLLGFCLNEGACDFIAELVLQEEVISPYMRYGKANEQMLWDRFQTEMYGKDYKNWLYNGATPLNGVVDLGYFMGYAICKSYYDHAEDKVQAIKDIIELEYTPESVQQFLEKSKYNGGKL